MTVSMIWTTMVPWDPFDGDVFQAPTRDLPVEVGTLMRATRATGICHNGCLTSDRDWWLQLHWNAPADVANTGTLESNEKT